MPPERDEANPLIQLIYGQLVRLGNNLNQMVRHLHRTGDPLPADLEPLLKDIRHIHCADAAMIVEFLRAAIPLRDSPLI